MKRLGTPEEFGTCTSIFALVAIGLFLICMSPGASAATPPPPDSRGVNGFAICGTLDPTSSYYVPGDPVYISEIFEVKVDSPNYEQAFKDFLKQKYGWTKYVGCSVSYTSDGATKTFNERLKQAGPKLVRTGWTLASSGASAAGTAAGSGTSSAAPATPALAGGAYWICRVTGGDGKDYNSDVFRGSDAGFSAFPAAFGKFVQSKYNMKAFQGSPTCTDYGLLGQQQAQDAMKGFASYGTAVLTGWKYGDTAPGSAATSAAAPPSAAGAASSGLYYVCTWSLFKNYYVSDVSGPTQLPPPAITLAFRKYVASKYSLGNLSTAGSQSCAYQNSEADAQKLKQKDLAMPPAGAQVIDAGWKYGMEASAGGAAPH